MWLQGCGFEYLLQTHSESLKKYYHVKVHTDEAFSDLYLCKLLLISTAKGHKDPLGKGLKGIYYW